jgi:hypothetical protein
MAAMALAVAPISATPPRFRATPIVKPDFIPDIDTYGTAGKNGCVDTDDLLEVINNWGECDPGVFCFADTNGTTNVDTDDLTDVTNNYCDDEGGDCEEECCMNCPSCEESLVEGNPPTLQDLINAVLANSDIPSNEKLDIIEILIELLG